MYRAATFLIWVCLLSPAAPAAQCDAALDPIDDGSGIPPLVISEINPGNYVEYFNTTGSPIALAGYQLCSPFSYAAAGAINVPAGGYATVTWPVIFADTDAGGEVILYNSSNFGNGADIVDFVCWGVNPHGSRKTLAQGAGKWSGACAPAITGGAIHRKIGTAGNTAADYDVTAAPSPMNCVPAPTGVDHAPPHPAIQLAVGPNPFSGLATIEYSLSSVARVDVSIYSVDGRRVRHLDTGDYNAGTGRLLWDGTDDSGRRLPSGVYLVRFSGNASSVTSRVTIVR